MDHSESSEDLKYFSTMCPGTLGDELDVQL